MKVLLVSGSRADYGGISSVYEALKKFNNVTPVFSTVSDIFYVAKEEIDLVVLLGDRSEILQTAVDFYISGVPIIHLSGGDLTEGSKDDCMRHAVTKLACLHFPTNHASAKRIIQMGEEPWRVKVVGYPGVDVNQDVSSFEVVKNFTDLVDNNFLLVVWHPNTFGDEAENLKEVTCLSSAIDAVGMKCLVIGPNKDPGNNIIKDHLFQWAKAKDHFYHFDLPRSVYLGLLDHTKCLIGNSSSGIYEAPSFGTPVINIGNRQKGRLKAETVYDCPLDVNKIVITIKQALQKGRQVVKNPYQTGNAALKIAEEISRIRNPKKFLVKRFFELKH